MVAITQAPALSFDDQQLAQLSTNTNQQRKKFIDAQLKKHPSFIGLETAFATLYHEYQLCNAQKNLSPKQKANLATTWQTYCQSMLTFIRYVKSTQSKKHPENTTLVLGKAYLKELCAIYADLMGTSLAPLTEDADTQREQYIYSAGDIEVLFFDKVLTALEKYYKAHQSLIHTLEQFKNAADTLASFDLRTANAAASVTLLKDHRAAFSQFETALAQLKAARATIDKRTKKLNRWAKRFSQFKLGRLFQFFWGAEQKMSQFVLRTVESRIGDISTETAEMINAQGSQLLRDYSQPNPDDSCAGNKLRHLNQCLQSLGGSLPLNTDVLQAEHQLKQTCITFISNGLTSKRSADIAMADYIGAHLQDCLALTTDHRNNIAQLNGKIDVLATAIGATLMQNDAADQLKKWIQPQRASQFHRRYRYSCHIESWQSESELTAVRKIKCSTPDSLIALYTAFGHILATEQLPNVVLEKLIAIKRYANARLTQVLESRIQHYLEPYSSGTLHHAADVKTLRMIFRVGNMLQRDQLLALYKNWDEDTILDKASDADALANTIQVILALEQFTDEAITEFALDQPKNKRKGHLDSIDETQRLDIIAMRQQCRSLLDNLASSFLQLLCLPETGSVAHEQLRAQRLLEQCQAVLPVRANIQDHLIVEQLILHEKVRFNHQLWAQLGPLCQLLNDYGTLPSSLIPLNDHLLRSQAVLKQNLLAIANRGDYQSLVSLDKIHGASCRAFLEYGNEANILDTDNALAGYILWQAFELAWQAYLSPENQNETDVLAARDRCLKLANELFTLGKDHTPQYPQMDKVLDILQAINLHNTDDDNDDLTVARQRAFLETSIGLETDAVTTAYPNVADQALWKHDTESKLLDELKVEVVSETMCALQACQGWLSRIDYENEDTAAPSENEHLFADIWDGYFDADNREYQLAAKQIIAGLCTSAEKYLAGFKDTPQVDRWSPAHLNNFRYTLSIIAGFEDNKMQLRDGSLCRRLTAIKTNAQAIMMQELLVSVFNENLPEDWRAPGQFADLDALDKRHDNLQRQSPFRIKEKQQAINLAKQLQFLATGKGEGSFIGSMQYWKRVNEAELYAALPQVLQSIDERLALSRRHSDDIRALSTHCSTPPAADKHHETRRNSAQQVADKHEQWLSDLVDQICKATLDDLDNLLNKDDTALARTNAGEWRLFTQRLRFVYTFSQQFADENNAIRKFTGRWLIDVLNQRLSDNKNEHAPENFQRVLLAMPATEFEALREVEPCVDNKAQQQHFDQFWRLVSFIEKTKEAAKLSSESSQTPEQSVRRKILF